MSGDAPAAPSSPGRERATRPRPTRRDGLRSRESLLRAAGRLLAADATFTLADVAAAAGVSTATAYRHFESAADLAQAFLAGWVDDIERRTAGGPEPDPEPAGRLRQLCVIWVDAVLDWGPALAHLRSPEGFLARRARGEHEMTRSLRHVEPAVGALLAARAGRAPRADELAYAMAVWNALSDPREVLDQHATLGWPADRVARHLHTAVVAVVADLLSSSR